MAVRDLGAHDRCAPEHEGQIVVSRAVGEKAGGGDNLSSAGVFDHGKVLGGDVRTAPAHHVTHPEARGRLSAKLVEALDGLLTPAKRTVSRLGRRWCTSTPR